jgi:glutamate-1-semialdehyde 2,1-aminomutase
VPREFAALTLSLPFNDIEAVRAAFREHPKTIAAIILEPIPANAGLYFPRENFLQALRDQCTKHGALLIFDEVMTGFRLARGGAQERFGVTPDLTCLGKIIGGGLPVGAYGGKREIMDQVAPSGPVYQAGTLSGNPLAMAAGLATLRAAGQPGFYDRLEELGARWRKGMGEAASAGRQPFTINQVGSMVSIFFTRGPVTDFGSAAASDTEAFKNFFWHMLSRGVYLAPSQYEAGFISALHSEDDLQRTFEAAREWFEGKD